MTPTNYSSLELAKISESAAGRALTIRLGVFTEVDFDAEVFSLVGRFCT